MSRKSLLKNSQAAVSVLFAAAAAPTIGLIGISIDIAILTEAKMQMALAADTAALNAVELGSQEAAAGNKSWITDGETNGTQWFQAQVGGSKDKKNKQITDLRSGFSANAPTVSLANTGTVYTATVNYSGYVPTLFASMFGLTQLNVAGVSSATVALNSYVNIALLLDNSSSMLIGATTSDINTLQTMSACSPEGITSGQGTGAWTGPATTCPTTFPPSAGAKASGMYVGGGPISGKSPPTANCGFACHWSNDNQTLPNGQPDYTMYDYYALARNPAIGAYPNTAAPALRFDVVQSAVAQVISTMESSEVIADQFGLGVFMFNSALTQVYPGSGEASTDLTDGATAVQNITTPVVVNNGDTNFPGAMTSLTSILTASGDGSTSATPRKNLFIVTDGIQDYGSRVVGDTEGPFSNTSAVAACNAIKAMGIAIYVLYTPYTPLPYNPYYASNINQFVTTPPTPNKISQALQACASTPANFFEADVPSQITTGLQQLLKAAVRSPARISS